MPDTCDHLWVASGHTKLIDVHGYPVDRVGVHSDKKSFAGWGGSCDRPVMAKVSLSDYAAERIILGLDTGRDCSPEDLGTAESNYPNAVEELLPAVEQIIADHEPVILMLTTEAYENGIVDGQHIHEIFRQNGHAAVPTLAPEPEEPTPTCESAPERVYQVAIHEAGRSILAVILSYFFWVKIHPNAGRVLGQTSGGTATGDKANKATIALGGYAAQKELLGFDNTNGSRDDFAEAWLAVGANFTEDYYPRTAQLVNENAAAIRGVADALMAARNKNDEAELDVTQARAIYEECQAGACPQPRLQPQPEPQATPVEPSESDISVFDRTVYHELGHAFAAVETGGWLIPVRVHPNAILSSKGGVTQCGHINQTKDGVIDIAGYAATLELLGIDDQVGPSNDFAHAEGNVRAHYMALYPDAAKIINDNAAGIHAAAAEMKSTHNENNESQMSGERVREIYEQYRQCTCPQPQPQRQSQIQQQFIPGSIYMTPQNQLPQPMTPEGWQQP